MSTTALTMDAIRRVVAEAMDPRHFIARPPLTLEWEHVPSETTAWEIFRGQLVPAHLTREQRTFESWNIFGTDETGRSNEPLLSIKLDLDRGEIHVVRGLLCYVWEGYDSGDNVYLSREVQRWVRELVGTLNMVQTQAEQLRTELSSALCRAVLGASRLPLTSVEAPLPAWSLGRLAYFHGGLEPHLADANLAPKVLEWLLRSTPFQQLGDIAKNFTGRGNIIGHYRSMFNDVSLSPYTDFVDKALESLRLLVHQSLTTCEQHVDFLAWLLRQLARHLTAYDLVIFHHRGSNYPDALLLDAALKEYLRLIETNPTLFVGDDEAARARRRALRLGWLHRRRYEGHAVPDAPTSPGENTRVMPPPHVRVPEEQILNWGQRKRRLYADDPLSNHIAPHGRDIMRQCGLDLQNAAELRELGMAIFVERPLAAAKAPGEPDSSPLLAHEAVSRSLAERGLTELAREPLLAMSADNTASCFALLAQAPTPVGTRPGSLSADSNRVVSLADAAKAAKDFVILRTLPGSVRAFCERPSVATKLANAGVHLDVGSCLIVGSPTATGKPRVSISDANGLWAMCLEVDELMQ